MDHVRIREYIILFIRKALDNKVFVSASFPDEESHPPFVIVSKHSVEEITTKANGLLSIDSYSGAKKWLDSGLFYSRISVYSGNDEQGQDIAYRVKHSLEKYSPYECKQGDPVFRDAKDPSVSVSIYKGETKLWLTDLIASFYYEEICEEEKKH